MNASASVSVIVSTHNSPHALGLVLAGYARQDAPGFEVVIADDGSKSPARDFVRSIRSSLPFPLVHVWQPHKGYYGKMAIMNRAIVAARGDYLILADGDVVPRHDFVRNHTQLRRPRCFLAGGDFRLSPEATAQVTPEAIADGRVFSYGYLRSIGQPATRRRVKLLPSSFFTRVLDGVNISPARWSGSNASAWKADLVSVGGFDETFRAPGKDDTELGYRLWHSGVRSRHVRHNTICLHLHHGMGNYSEEGRRRNLELLHDTMKTRRVAARLGIPQIQPGDHEIER